MLSPQTKEILTRLDKKKLRRLKDFISSPYFNTRPALIKLCNLILKAQPEFDLPFSDYHAIFKKLYPGKAYQEQTIKNLLSDFGNALKKFIGYEEIGTDEKNLNTHIATGLTKLTCFDISNKFIYKKLIAADKNLQSIQNFHYLKNLYDTLNTNLAFQNKHFTQENFQLTKDLSGILLTIFIRELFHLGMDSSVTKMFTHNDNLSILEETVSSIDMKKIFSYLDKSDYKYVSVLKLQYWMYYYYVNDMNEEQYYELKDILMKGVHKLSGPEKIHHILRLGQIIAIKLVPKDKNFYREVFALGKLVQSLNIYPNEIKILGTGTFRDYFSAAVILKEFDWAEKFIDDYGKFLADDQRENEINLRKGILFFKRGKYELSLDYLNKMKVTEIIEKINIRFYYMMNYIQLEAYESAFSSLNSIRQFYNDRKEIPDIASELILDSLKYFHEIIKCEEQGIKIDERIYREAQKEKRYYHKQYIREKMEKLF